MKKLSASLVVSLQYVAGTGKARFATGVTITLAPLGLQVAIAKFGGRWSEAEVRREFEKFPHRFKLMPGATMAKALGLLPESAKLPEPVAEAA